jgi:hypothetical protein
MSDKRDKIFKQYAIIGGCLGILTGIALLVLVLTLAPSNPNINAYYNQAPNGHNPWLGCTTGITLDVQYTPVNSTYGDGLIVTAEVSNQPPGVNTTFGAQQTYYTEGEV